MFKRLKKMLVESFAGAIGLGWIFATAIWDFTNALVNPLRIWMARSETFWRRRDSRETCWLASFIRIAGFFIDCLLLGRLDMFFCAGSTARLRKNRHPEKPRTFTLHLFDAVQWRRRSCDWHFRLRVARRRIECSSRTAP